MSQPSQHILALLRLSAVIAATAVAGTCAVPAAARADQTTRPSTPATTVPATSSATAPSTSAAQPSQAIQPESGAPPVVRVLPMPATVDAQAVTQLTNELNTAAPATLILIVPAPVTIAPTVTGGLLGDLKQASTRTRLVIVGSPENLLSAFRQGHVRFVTYDSAAALAASLGDAQTQEQVTVSAGTLAGLLEPATTQAGGGGGDFSILPVAVSLVLIALAFAGARLRFAARGRPELATGPTRRMAAPVSSRGASPQSISRRRQPTGSSRALAHVPQDPRLPSSGPAVVRSELHPEGYVELGHCLRRVRWADPHLVPPAPGEVVDVQQSDHGRLVAVPNRQTRNGRHQ